MDTLRIIDEQQVVWLNLTGSGNETASHVAENARMTLMFCSFSKNPLILRLYGSAVCFVFGSEGFEKYRTLFPNYVGARQIFAMNVQKVQESCGFAVPKYEFICERDTLDKWAEKKGVEGVQNYWRERGQV
jgi:hypothetical protein